jgi:REP element-mobilizing transposase RayT
MEKAHGRFGWRVHAWVLMWNHFHVLLETPEPNLDGVGPD